MIHFPHVRIPREILTFGLVLTMSAASNAVEATRVPNIILILADDLGWADLACYGNTYHETPRIDQLSREGMRCTNFYAGPVCSPTRSHIQSGRDQARYGITQHIPGHRRPFARMIDPVVPTELPLEVETIAERLSETGYATGYFGKWHLGEAGYTPADQGWQEVLEHTGHTYPKKMTPGNPARRTAAVLTERAIDFISRNHDKPFLLQVSHYAVHIPLSARPDLLAKYEKKAVPGGVNYTNPAYAALLEELDESVGALVDAVDSAGLREQTLIVFVSDNGGIEYDQNGKAITSNKPLRGEKGTLYEGGIRVPAIFRWPGVVLPASTTETPAMTMDCFATFAELARAARKAETLDSVSLVPLLQNPAAHLSRADLCWHLPHYHHSTPASAIRQGDWKLLQFFETNTFELYNLRDDPGETTNLIHDEGERAEDLKITLTEWQKKVCARMPVINPAYDAARAKELAKSGKSE
jgi:arylsulfatase A